MVAICHQPIGGYALSKFAVLTCFQYVEDSADGGMTKFMMNRLILQFDLHAALPYAAQLFIILSTKGIGALRRQGVKAQRGFPWQLFVISR